MSGLITLLGDLLTEGFSFVKMCITFLTDITLFLSTILTLGYGISPYLSIPVIAIVPTVGTISIIKFLLKGGK